MKKILLATTNSHKIAEYKALLKKYPNLQISLISLNDLNAENDDVLECGQTFQEIAKQKVEYYWNKYQLPVICDDSGLEVFSLNNFPGIYSKRWLEEHDFNFKIDELLKLTLNKSRKCQYVCALAFKDKNHLQVFTGKISGELIKPTNKQGFGFDIGFYLPKYHQTFYQLGTNKKNQISHRSKAFKQFIDWFSNL